MIFHRNAKYSKEGEQTTKTILRLIHVYGAYLALFSILGENVIRKTKHWIKFIIFQTRGYQTGKIE